MEARGRPAGMSDAMSMFCDTADRSRGVFHWDCREIESATREGDGGSLCDVM